MLSAATAIVQLSFRKQCDAHALAKMLVAPSGKTFHIAEVLPSGWKMQKGQEKKPDLVAPSEYGPEVLV